MPFPDYTSLPQYANILHLYKLDEESGTRSDEIGSCDLADNNTVLYGSGKIGNGADFERDNAEYLSATAEASADMNFTSGNFSISFWVKSETVVEVCFFSRGAGLVDGYNIWYSIANDVIYFGTSQVDARQLTKSTVTPLVSATLAHFVIVRNGTSGYIYKNGIDITATSDAIINPASSNRTFYVGRYDEAQDYLDGILDELIVWNVALSPAEVSTLYNWYSKVGLSGAISFNGVLGRKPKKLLTGSISFTGSLTRLPKILLEGAITFVGTLQKLPKKLLTGAITFSGTLITKVKKTLIGSISFIGNLTSPYLDGIWSLFIKRDTTWTGQDKETTTWTAQDKEDTDWTAQD